jgi:hypothetical protein
MWPLKIERYRRRDREPAVRLLARAFRDNPLNRAVIGPDANTRLRSNIHGMRAHLPPAEDHGVLRTARCGSDLAGMLISAPPFAWPFPAYLETDAPRNQPFYERAGFRTTGEIQVFGTTVWLMERPDRASGQP